MPNSRPSAVAGSFYPASPEKLTREVRQFLTETSPERNETPPKVLIAPHAGYVYSGAIAASAYARIATIARTISRVVLLGPAHRVRLRGMALPTATHFETPLGTIPIDRQAASSVMHLPQVISSDQAHAQEHSLEVHLPFMQLVLNEFALVPIVVGDATAEQVSEVLDVLWGGTETLIVVSSDLSHYLPYSRAKAIDEFTSEEILRLEPKVKHEQACGATPINGLLVSAKARGLEARLLDLRNSGDTAGDKSRVVGYASFSFHEHAA